MNSIDPVEYERRRNLHRPTDAAAITAEVRRLASNGYSARDIGGALNLDPIAVERLLQTDFHESTTRAQQ